MDTGFLKSLLLTPYQDKSMSVEDFKGQAYLMKKWMREAQAEIDSGEKQGAKYTADVTDAAAFAAYCRGDYRTAILEYGELIGACPARAAEFTTAAMMCMERLR